PVALGLVASLARPGGNITGLTVGSADPGKRVQILKEAIPTLSRLAVFWERGFPGHRQTLDAVEAAGRAQGGRVQGVEVLSAGELESAFAAATGKSAAAAYILGSPVFWLHRARIAEVAVRSRLPAMGGPLRDYVEAGCLIAYGPSLSDQYRRAAYFVD